MSRMKFFRLCFYGTVGLWLFSNAIIFTFIHPQEVKNAIFSVLKFLGLS